VALVGAGEFLPGMAAFDRDLLASIDRARPRVVILPTASAPDGEAVFRRWADLGADHFAALGAEVEPVLIRNREEAGDEAAAQAIGEAAMESGRGLILMTLASGKYDATCRKIGCRVASEGFADRAYNVDGTLVSRKLPGSLITDPAKAAQQAVKMATTGKVLTLDGVEIDISVQTICCHGDTPGAEKIVRAVREALEKAGVAVKPLRDWLPAQ